MKTRYWILLGIIGLIWYVRSRTTDRQPVQGTGDWVSVQGGTETVLPNYSGL